MKQNLPISEQLRAAIQDAAGQGLSAYRIAKLLGMQTNNLHHFARGDWGITLDTLDKVGSLLNVRLVVDKRAIKRLAKAAPVRGRKPKGK